MHIRADRIRQRLCAGDSFPIYQSLGVQGDAEAQSELGNVYSNSYERVFAPGNALRWYRKAMMQGGQNAIYNLAIAYRNWGDLTGYRHWLARAAQRDPEAKAELKRFKTRFPHEVMKRWHRYAPERD